MFTKNKNCYLNVAVGLALGFSLSTAAQASTITNLTEFYESYGSDFNQDQNNIIEEIFGYVDNYLESDGLQNAINDGFIPLTPEWIDHGVHWFNPRPNSIDITNMKADPLKPSGLNMSKDGELLGVFWAEELYTPSLFTAFQGLQQSGQLASLTPEQITQMYAGLTTNETPVPTAFDAFSDIGLGWHKHKNVIIENLDQRDANGDLNPQDVDFRQSLPNDQFIGEILTSLSPSNTNSVLSPLEVAIPLQFNSASGYEFNRGVSGGFHMLHMWIGQKNDAGLFAGTNQSIDTSNMAIPESQTFEDGSDGHGHGMEGGNNHGEHSQSVSEPSFVATLLGLMLLGFANKFPRKIAKVY